MGNFTYNASIIKIIFQMPNPKMKKSFKMYIQFTELFLVFFSFIVKVKVSLAMFQRIFINVIIVILHFSRFLKVLLVKLQLYTEKKIVE